MAKDNTELFENMPVNKAVVSLVIPTIISQLISVAYNMADTFFIGQIGDANQVAAASLCMPIFIFTNAFANLFGIGGSSLVSRSLGAGKKEKARSTAAFSIWTGGCAAIIYGLIIFFARPVILPAIGANADTFDFCYKYAFWTITIGALPTVMNAVLAHLVRSEGYSKQASIGMTMGGVLNIILDPIFIFVFGMEIEGAAIATMVSNLTAMCYFILLINRKKDSICISLSPKYYSVKDGIPLEVMLVGLPSSIMSLMGVLSNITLNRLMSGYCNEAIAGVGIAKKIDMVAFAVSTGISQGVLPLIGYNYSAKNFDRMLKAIKTTFIISLSIAVVCLVLLFTFAGQIVESFIDDPLTVYYGKYFQRVICLTGPCISVTLIVITMFQSVGKKKQPLLLSFLRKGGLDIPVMILLNRMIGINGIVWATPIADIGSMIVAILLFVPFWKQLSAERKLAESKKQNI